MATTAQIELSPREQQLKNLLLGAATHIDAAPQQAESSSSEGSAREPLVLRWAGGWVRDKLLGIESHDIDTAINSMTGEAFAQQLSRFCDGADARERYGIGPADVGHLHTIARNPEKSKHLETATTRLFGLDVDFVNLRKETYADDSRNPVVEFGTAEEDALRRDATVNALFYNLNTGLVEDFTGGLQDMKAKLIRTPMKPLQTFMDDPLRVLRLVRFASRLEFAIDPAAEGIMADERVLNALRVKISRERVGVEVEKMLKGKHPRESLKLIDRLGLYHATFTDPALRDMPRPDLSRWHQAYDLLHKLSEQSTPGSIYGVLVRSDEAVYFAWALAALAPFELIADDRPHPDGSKPPIPYLTLAAREGIKATNKLCDVLTAGHRHHAEIYELKDMVCSNKEGKNERDRFGMAIRGWEARGGHWRLQVLLAMLADVMTEPAKSPAVKAQAAVSGDDESSRVQREWQEFLDHLQALDVMEAPSIRRLLDGRQLAAALGQKPGKWMGAALEVVMAWQLRNPDVSDPAGAVEEVRGQAQELGIP